MADDAAAPEGELTESTGTELTGPPEESSESPQEVDLNADNEPDAEPETDGEQVADGDPAPDAAEASDEASDEGTDKSGRRGTLVLTAVAGLLVLALCAGVGWLGWQTYAQHKADKQRELFLQVGRQGAINLTTIDFEHADTDVQRILDSATGAFYDDFSKRSQPFTDVVKQAKSKSTGEVTAAGLESESSDEAQVLVAVTVKTTNAGAPEQAPRMWRMRLAVQNVGSGEAKVSNVEFVP